MCWLWNTLDFNYMHLWCNYYILVLIHVHIYCKQCAVTLIQRVQRKRSLLQTHHFWNALPNRNRVQCEHHPLTWARKKYAPHTHWKQSNVNLALCVRAASVHESTVSRRERELWMVKHWQELKRNALYKLYWRCDTASIVQVTIPVSTVQRAARL